MSDGSRFKLPVADRHLLAGYGPGIFLVAAFLLMSVLVPTIAPDQNVSATSAADSGVVAVTGQPATATGPGSGKPGHPLASTATAPAARGGVASAVTGGTTTNCSGPQVRGDGYSPPCVSFHGSNGGATSRGVTGNQITVSFRIPADDLTSIDAAVQQLAGKYNTAAFNDTEADVKRTIADLVTYFNRNFQFYGRKLVLRYFSGHGTLTNEITGGGQTQANADALTDADSIKAFADVSAFSQPFAQALSEQHVVNIGSPYMSLGWYQQYSPYAWSFFPNCTTATQGGAANVTRQLLHQKVTWAGQGVTDGQTRRVALIAPDNPVYQSCMNIVKDAMSAAGHRPADDLTYTANLSELSQEAASMEQRMVNDKITTVICACDPITLIYLTGDLDNANFEPEILNSGGAFTDEDVVAQLFDQDVWAHAAGETFDGTTPPFGSSLGYFAAKSVDPTHIPAHEVDIFYEDLYILALGIDLAGPDLTPATFQRGLFSYQGGNGEYGPWSFHPNGQDTWTPQYEYRDEWWDPKLPSPFNGQPGRWVVGKNWYGLDQSSGAVMPVFPNGPQ
ncbi:MAG TPA: hypothetical protein VG899_03305 [Mycobacteriales bacterium]|nr:hypothetical protein [Mycobacteriales bacterium]HWA65380.1 hypothetical protein [Mycobacteriales bacterium]